MARQAESMFMHAVAVTEQLDAERVADPDDAIAAYARNRAKLDALDPQLKRNVRTLRHFIRRLVETPNYDDHFDYGEWSAAATERLYGRAVARVAQQLALASRDFYRVMQIYAHHESGWLPELHQTPRAAWESYAFDFELYCVCPSSLTSLGLHATHCAEYSADDWHAYTMQQRDELLDRQQRTARREQLARAIEQLVSDNAITLDLHNVYEYPYEGAAVGVRSSSFAIVLDDRAHTRFVVTIADAGTDE